MNAQFWQNKKVFVTGHTGFKGSWLSLWLSQLKAEVVGYSLPPPTNPSLFACTQVEKAIKQSIIGDIRDYNALKNALDYAKPEVIFHLAAQPLVRRSYDDPLETYSTNVMGTANLLEAARHSSSVRAIVIITTDKCYENREWCWGYREIDPLGGHDPYSSSKACAELLTASFRNSFFTKRGADGKRSVGIASVRAGNVIGGGDWAVDRLVPDAIRALLTGSEIVVRNPYSIRPWQHVLEPLAGYLSLAEKMYGDPETFSSAWNFGPNSNDARPVSYIVNKLIELWGQGVFALHPDAHKQPHEATFLKLDCSRAHTVLGWQPKWDLNIALQKIVEWYRAFALGEQATQIITYQQISEYQQYLL